MTRVAAVLALLLVVAAPVAADPFLDAVVSHSIGTGGGAGVASLPAVVAGPPRGLGAFQGTLDTLSLGLHGTVTVAFTDNVVVDGPGPDLTVFENAFLVQGATTFPPYAEPGTVSVSADGVDWATFPCALDAPPYYPGCAGVYPVFANADDPLAPSPLEPTTTPIEALVGVPTAGFVAPPGSGGDSFDLAAVGVHAVRFVRIDASAIEPRLAGLSGFDLDAAAALHSVEASAPDGDGDGIPDAADGCPAVPDPAQRDQDRDGVGDACDVEPPPDRDGDGVADLFDVCPDVGDPAQDDTDADGRGDACDNCPAAPNAAQADADADGVGDACDVDRLPDADGDGIPDATDRCPTVPDPLQGDADVDGVGDACDRCPVLPDPAQADGDGDGAGDACDVCPALADPGQADADQDGAGDACDPCPEDAACLPLVPPRFAGSGRARAGEGLLAYVVPDAVRTRVDPGATTATLVVAVAPEVVPGSVRVHAGRRDLTQALGPFLPGTIRTCSIPLARRRTAVRLRAAGPPAGRRRLTDHDRFVFERSPR